MQNKNIVIGVGNLLFCDDGVGVIAVEYLKKKYNFSDGFELLDGGTLGFNLIEYFTEYDNVFIVDTISIDDNSGEIYKIPSKELLGGNGYKHTAHEVEVVHMLQACELYEKKADITIFGVVPKDIKSSRIGLSESLEKSFDTLIETIINAVQDLGVKVTQKNSLTYKEVLQCLV